MMKGSMHWWVLYYEIIKKWKPNTMLNCVVDVSGISFSPSYGAWQHLHLQVKKRRKLFSVVLRWKTKHADLISHLASSSPNITWKPSAGLSRGKPWKQMVGTSCYPHIFKTLISLKSYIDYLYTWSLPGSYMRSPLSWLLIHMQTPIFHLLIFIPFLECLTCFIIEISFTPWVRVILKEEGAGRWKEAENQEACCETVS